MNECKCEQLTKIVDELERRLERVEKIAFAVEPEWMRNPINPYDLSQVAKLRRLHR